MAYSLEHGLMPQILALIDFPPGTGDAQNKSKSDRHPYYKRPGRGHNRDCCDACGDCGDLLCCDSCPSSFHLMCIDPPLEQDDIPSGVWRCHHCKVMNQVQLKIAEAKSSGNTPEPAQLEQDSKSQIKRFFTEIVENCRAMNPIEFALPRAYGCYAYPFPGSSKPVPKKKRIEIETINISKSIIICFFCNKTSCIGSMIKCDSCPKYFHLDCLDPPLTVPPTGLWLCPLHPEPFIEQKLLKSTRLSERVRLWDRSREPIDQASITLNFFKKIHQKSPLFRQKIPVLNSDRPPRPPMIIPPAIMQCYNQFRELPDPDLNEESELSESEEEEIVDYYACYKDKDDITDSASCSQINNEKELKHVEKASKLQLLAEVANMLSQDFDFSNVLVKTPNTLKSLASRKFYENQESQEIQLITKEISEDSQHTLDLETTKTDHDASCSLPIKTEIEIPNSESTQSSKEQETGASKEKLLEPELHPDEGVEISEVCSSDPPTEKEVEAEEKVSKAVKIYEEEVSKPLKKTETKKISEPVWNYDFEMDDRPLLNRAIYFPAPSLSLLCINSGTKLTFTMTSIVVGRGAEANLDLSKYTNCQRIAARHAIIFYDSIYLRWELLNYGPAGTYVNNCLYGCDLSKPTSASEDPSTITVREKTMKDFQVIVQKRRQVLIMQRESQRSSLIGKTYWEQSCRCVPKVKVMKEGSWEGSACLNKGVRLQIGCAKFIVINTVCEEIAVNSEET